MKNKAIKLVLEFIDHCHGTNNEMELMHAKCCAKIAIKHILNSRPSNPIEYSCTATYWKDLEKEIDNLVYEDIENLRNEETK